MSEIARSVSNLVIELGVSIIAFGILLGYIAIPLIIAVDKEGWDLTTASLVVAIPMLTIAIVAILMIRHGRKTE